MIRAKRNIHTLPDVIRIKRYEEGNCKDNILHRWYLSLIYAPCLSPIVLGKGKTKRSVKCLILRREKRTGTHTHASNARPRIGCVFLRPLNKIPATSQQAALARSSHPISIAERPKRVRRRRRRGTQRACKRPGAGRIGFIVGVTLIWSAGALISRVIGATRTAVIPLFDVCLLAKTSDS